MKPSVTAAATLCLLAVVAQPASAAWTTSGQGSVGARAGQLVAPAPTCTGTTVRWPAAGGPATYSVYFANGANYPSAPSVVTGDTTAQAPGKVNVLVKAVVGSWSVQAESTGKICS